MHRIAVIAGIAWMGILIAIGAWLGFSQLFLDGSGILFKSGFGDIWILAILALPGYLLWNWGSGRSRNT
jgi:hypothetical protein